MEFNQQKELPENYIPKESRKKILLLSDDLRFFSGVGTQSKELILGTAHHYNWVQVGASVNHPDIGKIFDLSDAVSKEIQIPDASVKVIPFNGYGDPLLIRQLLDSEKPDALMIFTDPRFFVWLFQFEHEIRNKIPLIYWNIWDAPPLPMWNRDFYRSCDALFAINKQTYNINKQVLKNYNLQEWQLKYIPHGINKDKFYKIVDKNECEKLQSDKKKIFGDDIEFVVMYNSRNINRKRTSDIILAFKEFTSTLPKEKQHTCGLLLHTQTVDEHGTDLIAVIRDLAPDINVKFSDTHISTHDLNCLYNMSDVLINLSSAEGFGLGVAEAIMTETMVIVNVTGGLQDQVGFVDENNKYLTPDVHYNQDFLTNAVGKYKTHGDWAVVVFPNNRSLIGSPPTPYIFEERCDILDAANAIKTVYEMSPEDRALNGTKGRKFLCDPEVGMSHELMCERFISNTTEVFNNWTPRKRFDIFKSE